ncbi:MAG: protein phosphatase 2C domain-containing protein [Patescibacteria group bacterium]|jgi:serine/threonine protein phosphatase PrpC
MPRISKAEITPTPEIEKFSEHIAKTSEKSKDHADNEDSTFVDSEREIAGLFDGMGGGLAGGEASKLAKKTISQELSGVPDTADAKQWEKAIRKSLEKTQEEVIKLGNQLFFKQLDDPFAEAAYKDQSQDKIQELIMEKGMSPAGTTASVVKMLERPDGGADLVFGHTGDSRIYVLRKNGELKRLTKDQGALEEAVQNNYITKEEAGFIDQATSKEEILKKFGPERGQTVAFLYKDLRRGVKSALGLSGSEFQTGIERLEPGDLAIDTSDGIHDNLTDEEIKTEIMKGGTPEEISARLVEAAGKRVGEKVLRSKEDDKTAIVLEVPEVIEASEAIEEPTITAEQLTKMETDLQKLREMAEYLGKLLPMAKTMEKGLKPLTNKKGLEEIMGMGGARGVEDTLFTTQTEIMRVERTLAEHQGDIAAVQKITGRLRELRETREKQLKTRDQETIDQIKSRVA